MHSIRLTLMVLSVSLLFSAASRADNDCTVKGTIISSKPHTTPFLNGQVSYESRVENRAGNRMFFWSVKKNTTGYSIQAKWGTNDKPEKYLPKIVVKNKNSDPRCRGITSSEDYKTEDRLFSYRRKNWGDWKEQEPKTIFEVSSSFSSVRDPSHALNSLLTLFIPNANAQSILDIHELQTLYEVGYLPEELIPYYSPDTGLAVDQLMQDEKALLAYFSLGFDTLYYYTFLISDFPIDKGSASSFYDNSDISSDDLTPLHLYVGAEITPDNHGFQLSYVLYAEVLESDLANDFNPQNFYDMRPNVFASFGVASGGYSGTNSSQLNIARLSLSPMPGKGVAMRIPGGVATKFSLTKIGTLVLELLGDFKTYTHPIMTFRVPEPN